MMHRALVLFALGLASCGPTPVEQASTQPTAIASATATVHEEHDAAPPAVAVEPPSVAATSTIEPTTAEPIEPAPQPAVVRLRPSPARPTECREGTFPSEPEAQRIIETSLAEYEGNCPCPHNRTANGRRCGKMSAYCREGGEEPLCYREDLTAEVLQAHGIAIEGE